MYVYLDGTLRITQTIPSTHSLDNLDFVRMQKQLALVREFAVRSVDPYPTVVYTPGTTPNFVSSIGDSQRRWNSFML